MKKQSGKNKLVINEEFILIKININRAGIFPLKDVYQHKLLKDLEDSCFYAHNVMLIEACVAKTNETKKASKQSMHIIKIPIKSFVLSYTAVRR